MFKIEAEIETKNIIIRTYLDTSTSYNIMTKSSMYAMNIMTGAGMRTDNQN